MKASKLVSYSLLAFACVSSVWADGRDAVMFVGAHPDDSEGFAATAFLLREKYDIHLVDLTRGERGLGRQGMLDGTTGKIRVAEEEAACRLLGATPHFLCETNGSCHASARAAAQLEALLGAVRPKAVFCHWPVDTHADHVQCAAVVSAALDALRAKDGWQPQRYYYEVLACQTKNWQPQYSVDVTRTMDSKVAMLRKYACQNPGDELVREKVAQAERRGRERTPACRYAETFTTFDGQPIDGGVLEELPETARVGWTVGKGIDVLLRTAADAGYEVSATCVTAGCVRVDYVLRPTDESYIRCQLALPVAKPWSGRFWGFGNGGAAGTVSVNLGVAMQGDVVVHSDMGSSRGAFGKPEVVRDFGWRATHLMTVSGKELTTAFYGRKPTKCYFQGASTGGGQGFHEALRFPDDYDGILSVVPANTRIPLHVYFAWNLRLLTDANGRNVFSREELAAVEQAAIDWYADKDESYARGKYLTDTRYSAALATNILALAQAKCPTLAEGDKVARLHKMFEGPVLEGRRVHAGVPFSASLAASAGNQWMLRWFLGPNRPLHTVTDEELVRWLKEWGPDCDACGEGYARFAARGGKMIVLGGLEDSVVPYPSMVDWYERAARECGGADALRASCRLYLLPGRAHGAGEGRGCQNIVEGHLPLIRWVEEGVAPEELPIPLKGGGTLDVKPL